MAKFDNKTFEITGTFGKISVYKMRGIERPIVRTRGGASREKINKSPNFALTRMNNREFGGASSAASVIRLALLHVRHLSDYNFSPRLSGMCRKIMSLDDSNPLGYRMVMLSTHRHLLDGFSLNKTTLFDSVIRHPLACNIDREDNSVTVNIPPLSPGFNLFLPWNFSLYRIVVGFGAVADGIGYTGVSTNMGKDPIYAPAAYSPWLINTQPQENFTLTTRASRAEKLPPSTTLIVSVGIEIGVPGMGGEIVPAKRLGCAKILMTG
ncbi:hypothetical protein [Chitinophaga pinensis]|uniref:Uncharacterized protein n=1 Tax=Chitinophaga pinensis TaxID=79329 RepID=A0A5C6LPH7_9BACT|nr:hypothetical protein [Chitinophaga pinensis]TWV99354.1 hypothetical protein FEF09_16535 [Chitinophaga pinensis]